MFCYCTVKNYFRTIFFLSTSISCAKNVYKEEIKQVGYSYNVIVKEIILISQFLFHAKIWAAPDYILKFKQK